MAQVLDFSALLKAFANTKAWRRGRLRRLELDRQIPKAGIELDVMLNSAKRHKTTVFIRRRGLVAFSLTSFDHVHQPTRS
jgi:hypothetical protein